MKNTASSLTNKNKFLILGCGFSGSFFAKTIRQLGCTALTSSRSKNKDPNSFVFNSENGIIPNEEIFDGVTHILSCIPPDKNGNDPVLKTLKNRSVSIEALTDDNPEQIDIGNRSVFLVPLFLLPGSHVCIDVPKIFKRLQEDGQNIKLFPFLGSFMPWLSLIDDLITSQSPFVKPALIHHPVSSDTSDVFLKSLEKFLNIPLYSWSRWNQDTVKKEKNYLPIPYLLTPNKNVEIDSKGEQLKSLLEIDIIHRGLVNILGNLP